MTKNNPARYQVSTALDQTYWDKLQVLRAKKIKTINVMEYGIDHIYKIESEEENG